MKYIICRTACYDSMEEYLEKLSNFSITKEIKENGKPRYFIDIINPEDIYNISQILEHEVIVNNCGWDDLHDFPTIEIYDDYRE